MKCNIYLGCNLLDVLCAKACNVYKIPSTHLPGGAIKPGFESPLEIFWQRL